MMKQLTYGDDGFEEIEEYLKNTELKNFTLSFFDMMTNMTMEIIADYSDFLSIIKYVSAIEHDFPAWIGANMFSASYVVGLNFTRGHLKTPSTYRWENSRLIQVDL